MSKEDGAERRGVTGGDLNSRESEEQDCHRLPRACVPIKPALCVSLSPASSSRGEAEPVRPAGVRRGPHRGHLDGHFRYVDGRGSSEVVKGQATEESGAGRRSCGASAHDVKESKCKRSLLGRHKQAIHLASAARARSSFRRLAKGFMAGANTSQCPPGTALEARSWLMAAAQIATRKGSPPGQ